MHQTVRYFVLLLIAFVAVALSARVTAQGPADNSGSGPTSDQMLDPVTRQPLTSAELRRPRIQTLSFGFINEMFAERPSPVTAYLAPGTEAFDGALVFEYVQDGTQRARIIQRVSVPAIASGGGGAGTSSSGLVPVTVCIIPPVDLTELRVSLVRASNGAVVAERTIARSSGGRGDDPIQLPVVSSELTFHALVVGRSTTLSEPFLRAAMERFTDSGAPRAAGAAGAGSATGSNRPVRVLSTTAAAVPVAPGALSGIDLLVVRAEAALELEPRQLACVRQWVVSGGRLIVIADAAGAWRTWLPPGPVGDLVALSAITDGAIEHSLEDGLPNPSAFPITLAAASRHRTVELLSRGTQDGWLLGFVASPAGSANPQRDVRSRGLFAHGPVGFGFVAIVATEPRAIPATVNDDQVGRIWKHLLVGVLAGERITVNPSDDVNQFYRGRYSESGYATAAARAIDSASALPPVSHDFAWFAGGLLLALAIAIGPFDFYVLGRKRRSLSYFTLMGWVVVASAGALLGTMVIRSGETVRGRIVVIDAILDDQSGGASLALRTELSTCFAGQSELVGVAQPPGTIFRGLAAVQGYEAANVASLPLMSLLHSQSPLPGGDDPYGGLLLGPTLSGGGIRLAGDELSVRRWTLRAWMTQARTVPTLHGQIRPGTAEMPAGVVLGGLPAGATVTLAKLHWYNGANFWPDRLEDDSGNGVAPDGSLRLSVRDSAVERAVASNAELAQAVGVRDSSADPAPAGAALASSAKPFWFQTFDASLAEPATRWVDPSALADDQPPWTPGTLAGLRSQVPAEWDSGVGYALLGRQRISRLLSAHSRLLGGWACVELQLTIDPSAAAGAAPGTPPQPGDKRVYYYRLLLRPVSNPGANPS